VDNHLEPGCRVDVVGLFTVRRGGKTETIARTVLEDVEVAAVGQRLAPSAPSDEEQGDGKSSRRERPARAVTLLIKPEQAPTLHLAEKRGTIKLCMRGSSDAGRSAHYEPVVEEDLLSSRKSEEAEAAAPSWRDQFNQFVSSFWKKGEPVAEPEPEPDPEPAVQQEPRLAWVMAVYNGDERRVLGWRSLEDFQPIELSSEGPNIFQDEPQLPPLTPKPGAQTGGGAVGGSQSNPPIDVESQTQAEPPPVEEAEAENQGKPQELFE
jgi:hypothetical protein